MPPKKAATNGDASETGGKFTWEGPNDNKLLLLTQGRYVKPEEYEQLSTALGTITGSIRNRISTLRIKQRDLYEKLGWDIPEGGAGHSAKKPKGGGKRGISEDGAEPETPTKKPRVKEGKKETKKEESDGVSGGEEGVSVKEEEMIEYEV